MIVQMSTSLRFELIRLNKEIITMPKIDISGLPKTKVIAALIENVFGRSEAALYDYQDAKEKRAGEISIPLVRYSKEGLEKIMGLLARQILKYISTKDMKKYFKEDSAQISLQKNHINMKWRSGMNMIL
jgi:hypothetical protein